MACKVQAVYVCHGLNEVSLNRSPANVCPQHLRLLLEVNEVPSLAITSKPSTFHISKAIMATEQKSR